MLKPFFIFIKLFFILEILYILFIFCIEFLRICLHNHALAQEEQEMLSRRVLFEIRNIKKKNLIDFSVYNIIIFFVYSHKILILNFLILFI